MATWLPGVLVALIGIVPGVLVWRQAAQARQETRQQEAILSAAEARRVDQAAYDVARRIYEDALAEATRQLTQYRELELLRDREIGRLQQRNAMLRDALRRAGVPPPPEGLEP